MQLILLEFDSENELQSDVFESWEVSEDGLHITLTLRPNLEWNDGTPITSADVLMTLTHFLDPDVASSFPQILAGVLGVSKFASGETDSISGLAAPDDQTVTIELEEASPWMAQLASVPLVILPEHVLGDVPRDELAEHEYFKTFPVTSGPYDFVEWVQGQYIEYERNDNWSLGEAGFDRLFMKLVEPDVRVAQLETGEAQLVRSIDAADADRVSSIDGIEVIRSPATSASYWGLNHGQAVWQDQQVRQAMMYAIDREGICESVYSGYCSVPTPNIPPVPDWSVPNEELTEYHYDPERARELLDEAGWDENTELTFLNWQPKLSTVHEIVQGNLADVGINFSIVDVDLGALYERIENERDSFHALSVGGGSYVDPSSVTSFISCDDAYPDGSNFGHYCNKELDDLLEAGRRETDTERRAEIYHEAFRIMNEDVPNIYLPAQDKIVALDSRLKGVDAHSDIRSIGDWYWQE